MTELEKQIQEAENERARIKQDIQEQRTLLRIREAEWYMMESFIDVLRKLKSNPKEVNENKKG